MKVFLCLVVAVVGVVAVEKKQCFNTDADYNNKNFGELFKACMGTKTQADGDVYKCVMCKDGFGVTPDTLGAFLDTVGTDDMKQTLKTESQNAVKGGKIDYDELHKLYDPICNDDGPK